MQELGDHTIRRIDWQQICPAVLLTRSFKFALGFRVLLLAFAGLLLTALASTLFVSADCRSECGSSSEQAKDQTPSKAIAGRSQTVPKNVTGILIAAFPDESEWSRLGTPQIWHRYLPVFASCQKQAGAMFPSINEWPHPWLRFSMTCREMFSHRHGSLLTSVLWFAVVLLIWSVTGGMITRIAAMRFAADRRESGRQLSAFFLKRWLSYPGAIFLPLIGFFCMLLVVWGIIGLWRFGCQNVAGASTAYTLLLFVPAFPFALAAALIVLGLTLGWPLMFAAISVEGSDGFDAVSRAFSYVYQRPVQFVFYHVVNAVLYVVGMIAVAFVFEESLRMIGLNANGLQIVVDSFSYAYFWVSSTVIYFLLRRSCDATPFDEIYLHPSVRTRKLTPINIDLKME